jgi:acyl-CoA dehydrogenase
VPRHLDDIVPADVLATLRLHAAESDASASFPDDNLKALRASGLLGLVVPAEYGGAGAGLDVLVETAAELAGACMSTGMIWAMHCQQVDVLVRHGSAELREELLPRVAAGGLYLASVTTEPVKGGHLLSAQAALRDDGHRLWLDRQAPVVTGGRHADGFLITMRAGEDALPHQVSLVYADRAQLRVDTVGVWNPMGMRATDSAGLRLSGAVPPGQVVGSPGGFRTVAVESMIPLGHIGWAACWLGAARGALRDVVAELRNPDRRWALDLQSDLVRERLARIRVNLELVAGYLRQVCAEVTEARLAGRSLGDPATQIHLNTLKVAAAEMTFAAADRLVQFAGLARGYSRGSPLRLEQVFRDLRSASLNYADDRLLTAIGSQVLLDRAVRLA